MTKLEKLNKEFVELGFDIDGVIYTFDKVTYSTIMVNGQRYNKPEHQIIKLEYIGDGCEVDDSDSEIEGTEFFEFGVLDENDKRGVTLCIHDIEEFKETIRL